MNRVQWLREAEIRILQDLYEQPSPEDDDGMTTAIEQLRAEVERARQLRKREE